MTETSWQYSKIGRSDTRGFNDPGIETFTGDFERYLARETLQNSNDADILDDGLPVLVKYEKLKISAGEIPGLEELKKVYSSCRDLWSGDEKAKSFFDNALSILAKDNIEILKISDSFTTGVAGTDDDVDSPWNCLVHSTGSTSKHDNQGGSFGIGADAPFAASALRMVFYTTVTSEDGSEIAFAGRTKLASFRIGGTLRSGNGTFGLNDQTSIRDRADIPALFNRTERGTSIFIIGYLGKDVDWQDNLIKSVLQNFWPAIHENKIQVSVDSTELTSKSLEENMKRYFDPGDAKSDYYFYKAYTDTAARKFFPGNLKTIGSVKLWILPEENLPRQISMIRQTKMIIDKRFFRVTNIPFAGVFLCDDTEGDKILRDMEPPAHNEWDPSRRKDKNPTGKSVDQELSNWIRKCLRTLNPPISKEAQEITDLYKYLPDDSDYEDGKSGSSDYKADPTKDETSSEIQPPGDGQNIADGIIRREPAKIDPDKSGEEDTGGTTTSGGDGTDDGPGTGGGTHTPSGDEGSGDSDGGSGGEGEEVEVPVQAAAVELNVRSFVVSSDDSGTSYLVIIAPNETEKVDLKLQYVGEDIKSAAEIDHVIMYSTTEFLETKDNNIFDVILSKTSATRLKVTLNSKVKLTLEITAYEKE